ncbi:MAG: PilZ domain-containing protein [Deltaproteobacteria bacterium]|nr:PilZ domain-containing protein [Deltaproteobacteria bacterium]
MEPLKSKDKRTGIRIPLLSERVSYFVNGVEKTADITDITADGLFLKTSELLTPRTDISLQLHLPGDLGSLQVNSKVMRINWTQNRKKSKETLGMGVRFEDVQPNIKKIIDAYVVYLRNKQIITVSKRIIEEFFGSDNPKKIV